MIDWHWLAKTATSKEFKCFQPKAFLFHYHFFKEIEIVRLQFHLPCPSNNLFKNNVVKTLGSIKSDKNLGFLFLWSNESCYNWWAQRRCACNLLASIVMFWILQQWLKAHCHEFYIESWPESFFANNWPLGTTGPNYPKSANLKLH